jgi:protein-S-isoprenylcysteine O-methyltransferase Ste14
MIPALVIALPAILYRTRIEDQMLGDELMGYADYAAQVRFRLIPGIW